MNTTALPTSLTVEFELGGWLFATVHASFIQDVVGAHVMLDGNTMGDTGLSHCSPDNVYEAKWALRNKALRAIKLAHEEAGFEFEADGPNEMHARCAIAKAMPFLTDLPSN